MILALIRVLALYKLKTYSKWSLSMSIALFKCNDEVTQTTVSSMLEKYIITLEMLTKTFIVKIHSAYHTSKNIGIISF